MKKNFTTVISLALVICLLLPGIKVFAEGRFPDMPGENNWAYEGLTKAVENNILRGSNGKINPNDTVSRAQFAAVMNRVFGAIQEANISGYEDVPRKAWYAKHMAKALNMGTIMPSGENMLNPLAKVTKQEAYCAIAEVFCITGAETECLNTLRIKKK